MSTSPEIADRPESWPVVSSEDLHRDDWVMALRSDEVTPPGGGESFRRLVLEHPGAAIVLAVDDEERVFCLSQYRHPAQRRFIELPAGLLDVPGEDPEGAARRELREEAGLAADEWVHVTSVYPSPGILAEVQHVFLARGLREIDREDFRAVHEEDDMDVLWVPADDLLDGVLAGRVCDAPLVVAILVARARGLIGSRAHHQP